MSRLKLSYSSELGLRPMHEMVKQHRALISVLKVQRLHQILVVVNHCQMVGDHETMRPMKLIMQNTLHRLSCWV